MYSSTFPDRLFPCSHCVQQCKPWINSFILQHFYKRCDSSFLALTVFLWQCFGTEEGEKRLAVTLWPGTCNPKVTRSGAAAHLHPAPAPSTQMERRLSKYPACSRLREEAGSCFVSISSWFPQHYSSQNFSTYSHFHCWEWDDKDQRELRSDSCAQVVCGSHRQTRRIETCRGAAFCYSLSHLHLETARNYHRAKCYTCQPSNNLNKERKGHPIAYADVRPHAETITNPAPWLVITFL